MEKGFDDVLGAIADLHPAKLARNRTGQLTAWSSAGPSPDASDDAKGEGDVKGNSNDSVKVEAIEGQSSVKGEAIEGQGNDGDSDSDKSIELLGAYAQIHQLKHKIGELEEEIRMLKAGKGKGKGKAKAKAQGQKKAKSSSSSSSS